MEPSLLTRLCGKRKVSAMPPSDDFIGRFDLGLEAYWQQRTAGLARFQDRSLSRTSHALLVVIFVEFLLLALAQEVRNILTFAEQLRSDGSLTRNRVIYPNLKGLCSMLTPSIHGLRDEIFRNHESMPFPPNRECTKSRFFSLPFALLATIARFFRTDYAVFGLRAGCAAFAGSVPAFIATSATFYLQYRGVWIIIVIILCVNPTTGASLNSLLVQCSGALLGGLLAMAVWYTVDQNVAGVIVFTFVVNVLRNSHFYGS